MSEHVKIIKENHGGAGGAMYFFGIIGALFYFIPQASGLWEILVAIFKSLVWPAYFVYYVFGSLQITL